eukprot:scaffold848_cov247-Pinguiococcus_pyrenoidosus.AAC.14
MKLSMVLLVLGAAVAQAFRPMSRQVALQKVAGIAGGLLLVPSVAKAELGPDGYPKMSSLEGPPQPKPKMSADEAEVGPSLAEVLGDGGHCQAQARCVFFFHVVPLRPGGRQRLGSGLQALEVLGRGGLQEPRGKITGRILRDVGRRGWCFISSWSRGMWPNLQQQDSKVVDISRCCNDVTLLQLLCRLIGTSNQRGIVVFVFGAPSRGAMTHPYLISLSREGRGPSLAATKTKLGCQSVCLTPDAQLALPIQRQDALAPRPCVVSNALVLGEGVERRSHHAVRIHGPLDAHSRVHDTCEETWRLSSIRATSKNSQLPRTHATYLLPS